MDVCEIAPFSPTCLGSAAASGVVNVATGGVLASIGEVFGHAAESVMDAVFEAIATTTTVDLSAQYVTRNAAALASVAAVLVVGLFVVQVGTAAIRREPGGLARAVTGAAVAVLGTAVAATIVQLLLVVVDALCDGIAGLAGTSIQDAARQLLNVSALMRLAQVGGGGAALMIVFRAAVHSRRRPDPRHAPGPAGADRHRRRPGPARPGRRHRADHVGVGSGGGCRSLSR